MEIVDVKMERTKEPLSFSPSENLNAKGLLGIIKIILYRFHHVFS
jgi:hypothetical protein